MAITVVQTVTGSASGTTPLTLTLAATGAGNCLVVCYSASGTGAPVASGITLGGMPVAQTGKTTGEQAAGNLCDGEIWIDDNCTGGQTSLAITPNGYAHFAVVVYEIAGLVTSGVVDQVASATANSGTAVTSGSTATTTQASEIWVGLGSQYAAASITGPSSPWTNTTLSAYQGGSGSCVTGYQVVSSAGAATYASTGNVSNPWVGAVVTLKGAAPPGATVTPAVVAVTAVFAAPVIRSGGGTVTPAVLAATVAFAAPVIRSGAGASGYIFNDDFNGGAAQVNGSSGIINTLPNTTAWNVLTLGNDPGWTGPGD